MIAGQEKRNMYYKQLEDRIDSCRLCGLRDSVEINVKNGSTYGYGGEAEYLDYDDTQGTVEAYLAAILVTHHKPKAEARIPIAGSLPVPGEKISWTDEKLVVSTDIWIRGRNFVYDFDNHEVIVSGEGAISI